MFKAILFDLDGVLIDSSEAWFQVVAEAADTWGLPRISRERYHECFGQSVEDDAKCFFPGKSVGEVAIFYERGLPRQIDYIAVDPDAKEVIATLHAKKIHTAIITNTPSVLAKKITSRLGLRAEIVIGDGDVENPKPAPDMVLAAATLLEVKISETLVVGDTRFDQQAAAAAGARFAGMRIPGDYSLVRLRDVLDFLPSAPRS